MGVRERWQTLTNLCSLIPVTFFLIRTEAPSRKHQSQKEQLVRNGELRGTAMGIVCLTDAAVMDVNSILNPLYFQELHVRLRRRHTSRIVRTRIGTHNMGS